MLSTTASKLKNNTLYHLSFNGGLEGMWRPRLPDGNALLPGEVAMHPEPNIERICVSPNIQKCFIAIYPNISRFFEEEDLPHIDMHVYKPVFQGYEKIVTNIMLTKKRMVHDAHVTHEHMILEDVYMQHYLRLRIFNTNKSKDLKYRPFNDKKLKLIYLAPKEVKFEILDKVKLEGRVLDLHRYLTW